MSQYLTAKQYGWRLSLLVTSFELKHTHTHTQRYAHEQNTGKVSNSMNVINTSTQFHDENVSHTQNPRPDCASLQKITGINLCILRVPGIHRKSFERRG